MNKLVKLYQSENKELLETISLFNFALGFDKSIAEFKASDLFSFLERVESYEFGLYDDLYYMIDMLRAAFKHIANQLSSKIERTHEIMPISRANELDSKSIEWIARQNGITLKQKLAQSKVLGVKRYNFIDNPQNRVLKIVLMRLVLIAEFRKLDDENEANSINEWARFIKENLAEVNHKAQIIPNNTLLHHKHYAKFYKAYKWLNHLENLMSDFEAFSKNMQNTKEKLKKFIVLSLLHKYTNARILPSHLKTNQKEYSIDFEAKWLLEKNIKEYLNDENSLKEFKKKSLEALAKNNKIKRITAPPNKLQSKASNKIFMDIFRLYPLLLVDSKQITLPLLLKQEMDEKIINANHTKIIDMNNNFYTLPEILLSKNNEVFNVFLHDIKEFVGETNKLFYILPDYINVFDFDDKHRSIRAYFSQAFFINKTILAAAKALFERELKQDDTLVYFQKNNLGEIFVTPILVRYKKELKNSKSEGLFLEKHPCKKIKSYTNNTEKLEQKLLKKCLQNGVKALNENDIKCYENNKIYNIPTIQKEVGDNNIDEVKSLYKNSRILFRQDIKIIQDKPEENLRYFKELIEQQDLGFKLWGERLPKLDILIEKGFETITFSLVDEHSELNSHNELCIKNQFIIPANEERITAPLKLEDENIDYYMSLESNAMPFKKDIVCNLTLKYSYESDNIYTLVFTPQDNGDLPQIKAKWCKGKIKQKAKDMSGIYPPYPPVKSIEELRNYPKKKGGSGKSDLFEWVERSIEKIQNALTQKESATIYRINNDKNLCFARDRLRDKILCHKNTFINGEEWDNIKEGDKIFLVKEETPKGYRGSFISTNSCSWEVANDLLNKTRFPMISIFNGRSLKDNDIPDSFRKKLAEFIEFMRDIYGSNKKLKDEFLFFCSLMHDCSPIGKSLANNISHIQNHPRLLAYCIGDAKQEWQKTILNSVFDSKFKRQILILAIALWRSEKLVFEIDENLANKIIANIQDFLSKVEYNHKNKKDIANSIEVLLALLRLRQKNPKTKGFDILNPSHENTKNLIEALLKLSRLIVHKQDNLQSYLHLELEGKKANKYKNMPIIYALLSFIKGENNNSIKIIGVNDEN